MQVIRTILWVLLAVVLALFAVTNWSPVSVRLWDNLWLETKLPPLVIGAFLLGLLPMWLVHRATRWRLQRRIAALETSIASTQASAAAPPPPAAIAPEPAPAEPAAPMQPV